MTHASEAALRGIYDRVLRTWEIEKDHLFGGACGFSILGSRPCFKPNLMVVGENAGFSVEDDKGEPHIGYNWPCESYLDGERWLLKDRMRSLFQQAGRLNVLQDAVFTNFNFFKSGSISRESKYRWVDVDREVRKRVETASIRELLQLIEAIKPKNIMVLGMAGFDRHAERVTTHHKCSSKRRRLIARGELWSIPAFAFMHPSGARWSSSDDQVASDWLRRHFPEESDESSDSAINAET
ncbi:hypothetical protein GRI38_13860 [Altererythrobacter aurantiacus]|uniref:Uracil DNA glycosylase superfamily protein n=1 Tax=Parapontixanthobacter aurantiacus TaxID=1463599 RepID=A0A844ZHS5_9SPHN|nr:hypothetical protein [Parapontixanthobacter aurantiacus]MXO87114.1 hypothetical protein [Parapontixanthobacter aurantiacus]